MAGNKQPKRQISADEEATVSELVIGVDGRVHVFGTSREILESLDAIGVRGNAVRARLVQPPPVDHDPPGGPP
ncbi:MAG: hypothetical protein ACKO4Z_09820 [Planctomycetota bacterium]